MSEPASKTSPDDAHLRALFAADIARAATVAADGWAPAIPVPGEAREGRLGL